VGLEGKPGKTRETQGKTMEIQERECLSTHGSAHLTFQFPHAPRELTNKAEKQEQQQLETRKKKEKL